MLEEVDPPDVERTELHPERAGQVEIRQLAGSGAVRFASGVVVALRLEHLPAAVEEIIEIGITCYFACCNFAYFFFACFETVLPSPPQEPRLSFRVRLVS